jgi:hypothetical protein
MKKLYLIGKIFILLMCINVITHQNVNAQCNGYGGTLTPSCGSQQVYGGGGQYFQLTTIPGATYTISGFGSGCGNNDAYTVNCSNQYGTYQATASGSSWDIGFDLVPGSTGAQWCGSSSVLTYQITPPTTASVGATQNVCGLTSNALGGNTPSVGTGTWTQTGGPGSTTYGNANAGNTTATATAYGTYTYTWTINNGGCTSAANISVTYNPPPTASPGGTTSATVCSNPSTFNIPGGYGAANGTISWSTNGNGTFSNGTSTTPTYNFSASEIASGGTRILTMTVSGTGPCSSLTATTTFVLTIVPAPVATAGSTTSATVCGTAGSYTIPAGYTAANGSISWTSNGLGTITGPTTTTPTYIFTTNDMNNGGVITLTMTVTGTSPCLAATTQFYLTIKPLPTATTGSTTTATLCSSTTQFNIPSGYAETNGTISWTSSGDGTFTNSTSTTPTYWLGPNDIAHGGVTTLTMIVSDGGACPPASATFTLTIVAAPTAVADSGTSAMACVTDGQYQIPTGWFTATNGPIVWTNTGGDGAIASGNTTTPTYYFGPNDQINGGIVTLTMTVTGTSPCASASVSFVLIIKKQPVATAGTTITATKCATANLYTIPPGYTSANGTKLWSSSGDGTFTNGTTATPTYHFGPGDDTIGGAITLFMTVSDGGACPPAVAIFTLTIIPVPVARAGSTDSATVCTSAGSYPIPPGYTGIHGAISWATSGSGTFTNGTTTTPTYNFGPSDRTCGCTRTLTMTVTDTSACAGLPAHATFALTIDLLPIATPGTKTTDTVCASTLAYTIPAGYSATYGTISWSTSGDGTFANGTTATPTYNFGTTDIASGGLITLTMSVGNGGVCTPASTTFGLVISPLPIATAGATNTATVCTSALSYTIPAGYSSSYGTILWSTSGDGTFTGGTTLTPTYNFGTIDQASGGVITLTMTVADSGRCAPATATFALTIDLLPIATPGTKTTDTICAGALTYTIPAGYSSNYGTISWTTSGDGTFTAGSTTTTPTYTFGTNDMATGGLITLTMTVGNGGVCTPASTTFGLVISPLPIATPGTTTTAIICANALSYTIPAGYSSSFGTILWSTSGDGTFTGGTTLTPTYNFGPNDTTTGGVITLTMTVADSGICPPATATFALTIDPLPIATPGTKNTDTICTNALSYTIPAGYSSSYGTISWATSGTGTFTGGTTLTPTYNFGANDMATGGLITLTMTVADGGICPPASTTFALTIDLLPIALAGTKTTDTVCSSVLSYTIPAGYSSSYGTILWSTSGDGTFTGGTTLTPTYNFGSTDQITGGVITLTMTVGDSGICTPATATFALDILPAPIAQAGTRTSDSVCVTTPSYTIPGYSAYNGTVSWTTTGDGGFTAGGTTAAPTYTLGPNDQLNGGTDTLTMTVTGTGACPPATTTFILTIDLVPYAGPGAIATATVCGSVLSYTIPAGYLSSNGTISWTSTGDGTFTNDSTLTPTYNFGSNDLSASVVDTLTMTVANNGCTPATATFTLTILLSPVAQPGPKTTDTICATALSYTIPGYTALNGTVSWTTTGDGTFTNGTTVAPTYHFGPNDILNGGADTLTMTVTNSGVCSSASTTFDLVISPQPAASAGATTYDTLCANAVSYTIPAGYTSANGSILWSSSGDGTFTNGTTHTPTYHFGTNDSLIGGTKTLTMTIADSGICTPATATFALTIYPLPIATAGTKTTDTICATLLSYTIPGYSAANGTVSWATTGDGTFTAGSTTAAPTYTFGPNETTLGGLSTLTMTVTDSGICPNASTTFGLVVSPQPTASAGATTYDTLCANAMSYTIPAGYTSANGTILWSTSGDGTFTNGTTLTPTYRFGTNDSLIGGTKTLTMTIADSGICTPATATFALTIYALPIATAGPQTTDTICASLLSYTIPGYFGANGTISWATTGDGTFTAGSNTAAPTYTFGPNDLALGGPDTLTMTVTDGGICPTVFVSIDLVISPQPTASAGATTYDTLCASALSYTIPAGYTSANGTILWSSNGDGTFTGGTTLTPTYYFGTNDSLIGGTKTLTMTVADSGICVAATATFALTIYPLPMATAGPQTTDSICASALSYTIPGYSAANGDINWTTTGDGTFTNGTTAAPTYTFGSTDNANGGLITLTMTVTDSSICVPAIATFALTIYPVPTIATAGPRQNICASLTSGPLGGDTAIVGTGIWTQTSGTGTIIFSNDTLGSSTATASDTGIYIVTWTISNGVCPPTSASETLAFYDIPTTASVGPNQDICGSLISASLGGNTPTVGTGIWTQTSGPGTTIFSNPNDPLSTATASTYGATYVYTWIISNGSCPPSTANDTVNYYAVPTMATAGPTQNFCGTLTSTSLGGNTPAIGTGLWTQTSGPGTTIFSNSSDPLATATASDSGTYVYTWTISNGTCPPSTASITVNYYAVPVPTVAPTLNICGTLISTSLGGNTPSSGTGLWTQTSGPGTSTFSNASSGSSTATASVYGTNYVYTWTITNGTCPPVSASETVNYYIIPAPVTLYDTLPYGGTVQIGTQTYSSTGIYSALTTSVTGCDSVVNLYLFVDGATTYTTLNDTVCQGGDVTVNYIKYYVPGTYIDTLIGLVHSDSIVTLNLVVVPYTNPTISITVSHGPVVAGMQIDTFTANYTDCEDPYFSWYQDILPLGIHDQMAIVVYPVGQPDSFICRVDCRKGCPAPDHTFSNFVYIVNGINELVPYIQGMSLYPNPTQGTFNMDVTTTDIADKEALITITDLIGQPVLSRPIMLHSGDNKEVLSLRGNAAGIYIVQLTVDGQSIFSRIVLDK